MTSADYEIIPAIVQLMKMKARCQREHGQQGPDQLYSKRQSDSDRFRPAIRMMMVRSL
jgi:hypothetical protein